MKKRLSLFPALLIVTNCLSATSTTINLTLSKEASDSSSSLGSVSLAAPLASGTGGASQSTTYTITGLSLDNFGTADDSITFTLDFLVALTQDNTDTISGIGTNGGFFGVRTNEESTGQRSFINPKESLNFSFGGATAILGAGGSQTVSSIDFNGFTGFSANDLSGSDSYNVGATINNNATGITDTTKTFTGSELTFTIEGNNGGIRYGDILTGVTVNVIPEPSTYALLTGFLGIAYVIIRRNR